MMYTRDKNPKHLLSESRSAVLMFLRPLEGSALRAVLRENSSVLIAVSCVSFSQWELEGQRSDCKSPPPAPKVISVPAGLSVGMYLVIIPLIN